MDDQTKQILQAAFGGLVRHALTTVAGTLVTYGVLQPGDQVSFVTVGVGIVFGLVALGWSYLQKKKVITNGNGAH